MFKSNMRRDRGYTLVELLVTIGIISTLAAIAIPVALGQRTASIDAAQKADLLSVSTKMEDLLTGWNNMPPAQVAIATEAGGWTATPVGYDIAADGKTSEGTIVTGTVWTDGSYCLTASNTSGHSFIFRSDDAVAVQDGTCPSTGFGTTGTLPTSETVDLPAAVTGLSVTSPNNNQIIASWDAVEGATGYTVKISGIAAIDYTGTTATINGVNIGTNRVVVYAKNQNGAGPGVTATIVVNGQATAAPSTNEAVGYAMSAGQSTVSLTNDASASASVVFPNGRFSVAPIVTATIISTPSSHQKLVVRVTNISATNATIRVYTDDGSNVTASVTVNWIAMQMAESSAVG
jgi:prepilin-type N-terminal cleavage/methylation domain-containing protein